MSEVKVNKISPRSGTQVTLGDSGDTITVPAGATFDASSGTLTVPNSSISVTQLSATGTKDSTTFLRGDNTFQVVTTDLVNDTTPQLGGALDINSQEITGSLIPSTTDTYDLGSASKVWANIYTGDLNLNNESKTGNDIDGSTGSWTIQEGSEDLFLINRKSGKKYKFKLEEI